MVLEVGRVCIKTAGREAGKPCVVIDAIDDTYVMITGPKSLTKVKRRKCNIAHLEPLEFQLKLAKNAPDNEVARLLEAEKILEKLIPGKAVIKPERPEVIRKEPEGGRVPEKEKKGLRERLLGRAKGEEKPKEEKKPGKPKEEKKPGKPKEEKKPEKPKDVKKPERLKEGAKPKKAEKPEKEAKKKPAKKARSKKK